MKNILLLTLTVLLTNCDTSNKFDTEEFVRNSAFIEVHESDTTWLSFRDTTYEMWTTQGQQQNGTWILNEIKDLEFLTLGEFCPGVYELVDKTDKTLTLKEVVTKESNEFILTELAPGTFERRIKKIKNGS